MAQFDFPSSPSTNQTYTANGVSFKWDGVAWRRITSAPEFLRVAHTNNTHNQTLTDNTTHWVQFGSTYDDTESGWTSGSNNYYTIQTTGYFLVTAQAVITSNTPNSLRDWALGVELSTDNGGSWSLIQNAGGRGGGCLLYTSDAADE